MTNTISFRTQISKNRHEQEKDKLNDLNNIPESPQALWRMGVYLAAGCRLFGFASFHSEPSESASEKKEISITDSAAKPVWWENHYQKGHQNTLAENKDGL